MKTKKVESRNKGRTKEMGQIKIKSKMTDLNKQYQKLFYI